jgi:acyl carrier protein
MTENVNTAPDIRKAILEIMAERLSLDDQQLEQLGNNGRLDQLTAVDSLLTVELVFLLEEHFQIRFDAEQIDEELVSSLDKLTEFVLQTKSAS